MARSRSRQAFPIPEGYEDQGEGWEAAFQHAMNNGCSEKASILYADAHAPDFEDGRGGVPPSPDEASVSLTAVLQENRQMRNDLDERDRRIAELEAKVGKD